MGEVCSQVIRPTEYGRGTGKTKTVLELVKVQDPRQDTETKDEGIKDGNESLVLGPGMTKEPISKIGLHQYNVSGQWQEAFGCFQGDCEDKGSTQRLKGTPLVFQIVLGICFSYAQ